MENRTINLYANNQTLVIDKVIEIVSDTENYIHANVDLGENWQSFDSVRAIWSHGVDVPMVLNNGRCKVPADVIADMGVVKVNLVGSNVENDVLVDRLTTEQIPAILVKQNVPIGGTDPQEVTPSQFEQYVAIVRDLVGSVKDIDHIELNSDYTLTIYYSDGTSDTTTSIRGADGNGIASVTKTGTSGLVDTYTITFTDGQTTTFTVTNGQKGDTGNGIQSIAKTSTVGLVETYTITYTDGTTTTFTITNGEKGDKGDTGEVSLSELEDATIVQTLSDTEPYNFRRTNNGNGAGHREYDEIVGGTVAWNQLVPNTNKTTKTDNGITFTVNADGSVTLNGTATADATFNYGRIDAIKDHKYAVVGIPSGASSTGHKVVVLGTMFADTIRNISASDYWTSRIIVTSGTTVTNVRYNPLCIDLTLALGSTIADYVYTLEQSTAGSGVAWLKKYFDLDSYHAYDSGSIQSVSGLTAHEMVGKNLFDKSTVEVGKWLDINTGVETTTANSYALSDYIPVIAGQTYTITNPQSGRRWLYDSDKQPLSQISSLTFTPTQNGYARFTISVATVSLDTIQLEMGSANTSFEPYESHTYTLDPSVTLRGKFTLDGDKLKASGDVWKSDGTITRKYGTRAYQSGDESDATVVTDMTTTVYPLTTPTTETATPYTNPQWCDANGTEEYVSTSIVPIGHNTEYPMTLVDTMPSANGTYEPRVTISNGVKTITWVSV